VLNEINDNLCSDGQIVLFISEDELQVIANQLNINANNYNMEISNTAKSLRVCSK
jgi:hypothetical protein